MWTCLKVAPWGQFQSLFIKIPAIQFNKIRTTNRISSSGTSNQKKKNKPVKSSATKLAQVSSNDQGTAETPREILCCASLNKMKISQETKETFLS